MEKRYLLAIAFVLVLVTVIALLWQGRGGEEGNVVERCVEMCLEAKERGVDLSPGPCLGSPAPGWVCDVAHWPRKEVDNLPENQCEDFREGRAKSFVEVDEGCRVIRVWRG